MYINYVFKCLFLCLHVWKNLKRDVYMYMHVSSYHQRLCQDVLDEFEIIALELLALGTGSLCFFIRIKTEELRLVFELAFLQHWGEKYSILFFISTFGITWWLKGFFLSIILNICVHAVKTIFIYGTSNTCISSRLFASAEPKKTYVWTFLHKQAMG